jgi:hypothetical protein
LRVIKLLSLLERNPNGLRVSDIAEQPKVPPRAVYRALETLAGLDLPLYPDKNGKESYWKIDPDYRTGLSIPFSLSERRAERRPKKRQQASENRQGRSEMTSSRKNEGKAGGQTIFQECR